MLGQHHTAFPKGAIPAPCATNALKGLIKMTDTTTTTTYTFDAATMADTMAAYAAGDAKVKGAIRAAHAKAKDAAVAAVVATPADAPDFAEKMATMAAVAAYVFRTEKVAPTVDYAAHAASRIAYLYAAIDRIASGDVIVPEGVVAPTPEAIHAALADRGLFVDGSTDDYVRLSGRKADRARSGAVADFIVAALESTNAPMTAAMIAKSGVTTDDYAAPSAPSVGAIGAAIARGDDRFDTTDLSGTVAVELS